MNDSAPGLHGHTSNEARYNPNYPIFNHDDDITIRFELTSPAAIQAKNYSFHSLIGGHDRPGASQLSGDVKKPHVEEFSVPKCRLDELSQPAHQPKHPTPHGNDVRPLGIAAVNRHRRCPMARYTSHQDGDSGGHGITHPLIGRRIVAVAKANRSATTAVTASGSACPFSKSLAEVPQRSIDSMDYPPHRCIFQNILQILVNCFPPNRWRSSCLGSRALDSAHHNSTVPATR